MLPIDELLSRWARALLVAAVLQAVALAQFPQSGWIISTAQRVMDFHTPQFLPTGTVMWSQGSTQGGVCVASNRSAYVLDGNLLVRLTYDALLTPYSIIVQQPWQPTPLGTSGGSLFATQVKLFALGFGGDLYSCDLNLQGLAFQGNVLPASAPLGRAVDAVTDGRRFYVSILKPVGSGYASEVWSGQIANPGAPLRLVASIPSANALQCSLALALGEHVLALGMDGLYDVDCDSGQVTLLAGIPPDFVCQLPVGLPRESFRFELAYDPWMDIVAMGPTWWTDWTFVYTRPRLGAAPFSLAYSFSVFSGLRKMTQVCDFPYEVYGVGCTNATGSRAAVSLGSLPQQGGALVVTVREAEANGLCVTWFGLSDTYWNGVGVLPWDAAPIGAPGCAIYASPEFTHLSLVDAGGASNCSVAVPVNPALSGMPVFVQAACSSSSYVAGFAGSDALLVRLR